MKYKTNAWALIATKKNQYGIHRYFPAVFMGELKGHLIIDDYLWAISGKYGTLRRMKKNLQDLGFEGTLRVIDIKIEER